jgi:hypothetical protein
MNCHKFLGSYSQPVVDASLGGHVRGEYRFFCKGHTNRWKNVCATDRLLCTPASIQEKNLGAFDGSTFQFDKGSIRLFQPIRCNFRADGDLGR